MFACISGFVVQCDAFLSISKRRYIEMRIAKILTAVFIISVVCCVVSFAQEDRTVIDKSKIPAEGKSVSDFVPPGWKLEEQVTGDLNGDSVPDYALKLVEDKPAKNSDDFPNERQRALVILLRTRTVSYVALRLPTDCCSVRPAGARFICLSKRPQMSQ